MAGMSLACEDWTATTLGAVPRGPRRSQDQLSVPEKRIRRRLAEGREAGCGSPSMRGRRIHGAAKERHRPPSRLWMRPERPECRSTVRIARQQRLLPRRFGPSRSQDQHSAPEDRISGIVTPADRRAKGKRPAGALLSKIASPPISRVLCPASAGRSRHVRGAATIHLRRRLPGASSDRTRGLAEPAVVPLFGLAPGGVYLASRSPGCWRALTSPFHLCRRFRA